MTPYTHEFYAHRHDGTVYSAQTILSLLLERMPTVQSAIDIGCGVGTWLSVLRENGVTDIHGLDGDWVDQDLLAIPRACFEQADLSRAVLSVPRRYDLALSLEVAEHLPSDRAAPFVSFLTSLSDYVLFSAAIPFQGGTHHVNEQWQHYWVMLFGAQDYGVVDCIRPQIWNDAQIPFWYRQNTLLFVKHQHAQDPQRDAVGRAPRSMPLDLVHPELYLITTNTQLGVKGSFRLFRHALSNYMRKQLGQDTQRQEAQP